jgi:hypothetical protein
MTTLVTGTFLMLASRAIARVRLNIVSARANATEPAHAVTAAIARSNDGKSASLFPFMRNLPDASSVAQRLDGTAV